MEPVLQRTPAHYRASLGFPCVWTQVRARGWEQMEWDGMDIYMDLALWALFSLSASILPVDALSPSGDTRHCAEGEEAAKSGSGESAQKVRKDISRAGPC